MRRFVFAFLLAALAFGAVPAAPAAAGDCIPGSEQGC